MLSVSNIKAIIYKTLKEFLANKSMILISFMFPILAYFFKISFSKDEYFEPVTSFLLMNVVMIPIIISSNFIVDEKENGLVQLFSYSRVRPLEYIIGTSLIVFILTILTTLTIVPIISEYVLNYPKLIVFIILGTICSLIVGLIVGYLAKTQNRLAPIVAPVSMVLGMLPVFSNVHPIINACSSLLYTKSLSKMVTENNISNYSLDIAVFIINIIILLIVFNVIYRNQKSQFS